MPRPSTPDSPLCIALDTPDPSLALSLAQKSAHYAGMFKVGLTSFAAGGVELVEELADLRPVFVDLKLADIPAQVAGATKVLSRTRASLVTVHALGGRAMMRAAVDAAADKIGVLAVTVMTSLDDHALVELGLGASTGDLVVNLAEAALAEGATGLVCSGHELAALRDKFGERSDGGPLLAVPGVRVAGVAMDDQLRAVTPKDAIAAGADIVVVGRSITQAADPARAARTIAAELASKK